MDHLDQLEQQSVYILREAFKHFERLCMLWSIGKDSTVMLWLARKAFFGHVPFPLVHVDTSYKLPEMIAYRDKLALEYKLQMVVGQNKQALDEGDTFPQKLARNPGMSKEEQATARTACCGRLKSDALGATLHGTGTRMRMNLVTGQYEVDPDKEPYTGVIVGARADEEGSRSKERYFSPRDEHNNWEYIKRESIPTVSLYYDQGSGTRYRSLGCGPCQAPIKSTSKNVDDIIAELKSGALRNVAERSGRLQDGKHGLEELRRKGYM